MKRWLLPGLLLCIVGLAAGCDCDEAPSSHKGARLTGCSGEGEEIACCSYGDSDDRCSYVVCRDSCNGSWKESSWSCY